MTFTVLVNAGPWVPIPPPTYGGIEAVVATLVPELRKVGIRVVLATVGPSTLEADDYIRTLNEPRLSAIAQPYNQVSGIAHAHMGEVIRALRDGLRVDLVHDHLEVVGPAMLAAMGREAPLVLQTLHWDLRKHPEFYSTFDGRGRVNFAAVSQSQLDRAPANLQAQTLGVVPLASPPPPRLDIERGDHALVLARVTRDKGQDIALRVCRSAGMPLVLAGPVAGISEPAELDRRIEANDPTVVNHPDVRFFLDSVAPHLDGVDARWVGCVGGEDKERLLQSARVLLAPIRWAEPGATGVVEALGRGVPVVGTPHGVLPSLVDDGITGYLADNEAELAAVLGKLDAIDPADCRASAVRWTPEVMAASYLDLYRRLVEKAFA